MTEKQKAKIRIFNKDYSLLVDNESMAKELARYVNEQMNDIKMDNPSESTENIAIIAAVNIAYDLFIERANSSEFAIQATDRIKKISLLLNESENIPTQS